VTEGAKETAHSCSKSEQYSRQLTQWFQAQRSAEHEHVQCWPFYHRRLSGAAAEAEQP